jgi:hypothetical protein
MKPAFFCRAPPRISVAYHRPPTTATTTTTTTTTITTTIIHPPLPAVQEKKARRLPNEAHNSRSFKSQGNPPPSPFSHPGAPHQFRLAPIPKPPSALNTSNQLFTSSPSDRPGPLLVTHALLLAACAAAHSFGTTPEATLFPFIPLVLWVSRLVCLSSSHLHPSAGVYFLVITPRPPSSHRKSTLLSISLTLALHHIITPLSHPTSIRRNSLSHYPTTSDTLIVPYLFSAGHFRYQVSTLS